MPELPEVETMVRGLRPALEGRTLRALEIRDPLLMAGGAEAAGDVARRAQGRQVESVTRRGKWVVVVLEPAGGVIVIQPRMTGGFWLVEPKQPAHVRLIFHVDGSEKPVWYCDARRLGKLSWHADLADAEACCARSQGPEALVMGREELGRKLKATARAIKPVLMDQKVLSGIGNIYADEILFRAGLHPSRPADRLTRAEVDRLHAAIRPVLDEAIAAEGSSFDAGYRTVLGLEGGFLAQNAVHRRKGQACPRCGTGIEKVYMPGLVGRPTYFCPGCQAERRRGRRKEGGG